MISYAASALSRMAGASSVASCVMCAAMAAGSEVPCTDGAGSPPVTIPRTSSPRRTLNLRKLVLLAASPRLLGLVGLVLVLLAAQRGFVHQSALGHGEHGHPVLVPALCLGMLA